jgi:hypothetical protein
MDKLFDVGEYRGVTDGWVWVTDGHVIVMRRGELPFGVAASPMPTERVQESSEKFVRRWVGEEPSGRLASVKALQTFSGQDCPSCVNGRTVCYECRGTGKVSRTCDHCDDEHECDCECDDGREGCPDCGSLKLVSASGVAVDWRLLRKVLASCSCATVRCAGMDAHQKTKTLKNAMLVLFGDDWRANVMGMVHEGDAPEEFAEFVD